MAIPDEGDIFKNQENRDENRLGMEEMESLKGDSDAEIDDIELFLKHESQTKLENEEFVVEPTREEADIEEHPTQEVIQGERSLETSQDDKMVNDEFEGLPE